MEKISHLQNKWRNNKDGIHPTIELMLRQKWEKVNDYQVICVQNDNVNFVVKRRNHIMIQPTTEFHLNLHDRICTCGKWQEFNYPCIDALAVLKLYDGKTIEYVLQRYVSKFHSFLYEWEFLARNMNPVCRPNLKSDGVTKPPKPLETRPTGRPKNKRLRSRPAPPNPNNNGRLPIRCKKCGGTGHNVRTCDERQKRKLEAERLAARLAGMTTTTLQSTHEQEDNEPYDESGNDSNNEDDETYNERDDDDIDPFAHSVDVTNNADNDDPFANSFMNIRTPPDILTRMPRTVVKKPHDGNIFQNRDIF
jgi:hypothetical protein